MKYKALFLDIDDTLIGDDKIISPGNKEAIRQAKRDGAYVTIATGRGHLGAKPILDELDIRGPVIVYGGAMIVDTASGKTLFQGNIDSGLIAEALHASKEWGIHAQIYQGDTVIYEQETDFVKRYTKILKLPYVIEPQMRQKTWENVPKILAYAPIELESEMIGRYKERFEGRLEVASSKPGFIELNKYGVNKGTALLKVADILGIPIEETIAVGDNTLDVEMINMAGLGVCVESGQPSVKAIADVIAPACGDDGVKWVIEEYILDN